MSKSQLNGAIEGPAGQAPQAAWSAVGGELTRPQDLWIQGRPAELLHEPHDWRNKLRERWQAPRGPLGLRLRFVVEHSERLKLSLVEMVRTVLECRPKDGGDLFLHAEVMLGPEEGLYIAYENRPPALLTQVWLASREQPPVGKLPEAQGPLHANLVLHDADVGFPEIWNDGTLEYALQRLSVLLPGAEIHQLTVARSDAQKQGLSLGVERARREDGSEGGASAADLTSRATLPFPESLAERGHHPGRVA
jgi:hypothetical protein